MSTLVRRMTEADIEAAATVQAEAFGGDVEAGVRSYREGPRSTWRDGWVVEEDGEVYAAAKAYPTTWWYGGVAYSVSAIGGVAVGATARRRGYASQIMRSILQADYEAGRPFSLLYPFQHGFYCRLGYAPVGLSHFYRIPVAQLPDEPQLRRNVRLLRETDRDTVQELHARSLAAGVGGLARNERQWAQRWTKGHEKWVVYDGGEIQGYLAYGRSDTQLEVRELIADTSQAERGLWAFMAAQIEQCRTVVYHAPFEQPLWAILREPLMYEAVNRGFTINDAAVLTASLMARLVDIPAAFGQRQFEPDVSGKLTLALCDPVLQANTATFTISFEGGRAEAVQTKAEPTAICDMVTLSQLFCNVVRVPAARWYGLLDADDAATALLDQAFVGPAPFIHPADWF